MEFKQKLKKEKVVNLFKNSWVYISIIIAVYLWLYPKLNFPLAFHAFIQKNYDIIAPLVSGYLTSWFFYFLVVYLPARKREKIAKAYLKEIYYSFKESVIAQFMFALHGASGDDRYLCNMKSFKEFFEREDKSGVIRWHDLWNKMEKEHYQEIKKEMKLFERELLWIQYHISIKHEVTFKGVKYLQRWLFENRKLEPENSDYEDDKPFMRGLWELFTGESFSGARDYDHIEKLLKEL